MPHVTVKLWPGKSEQRKKRLADEIVKDVMSILDYPEESVSIAIEEVGPKEWTKSVYEPEIQAKWDKLYHQPGYTASDDESRQIGMSSMAQKTWSKDELRKIAHTDDLHISPFREDGKTYGTPTWIWSVVVDDGLYVRAYNGKHSRWYQAAMRQKAGRITAGGITKEVSFEPVEGAINDRIDDVYRAKYKSSPYLGPMISAKTRAATVKIVPREPNASAF